MDQKGNSFWYTDKWEELESKGLKDAFKFLDKDMKVYSLYCHQGNGYRYDHSYLSEDITPLIHSCEYLTIGTKVCQIKCQCILF